MELRKPAIGRWALAAIVLGAALLALPASAWGGIATISQCRTADGKQIDSSLASLSGGAGWLAGASCGSAGGGHAVASFLRQGSEPTAAVAAVTFTAPGATRIVAFNMHRQLRNYVYYSSPDRSNTAYDSWGLGYRLIDDSDRVMERCGGGTIPTSGRGTCASKTGSDLLPTDRLQRIYDTKRLSFQFGCFTAGYCSHFYDAPGVFDIYGDLAIEDPTAPVVSFTGGALSQSPQVIGPNDAAVTIGASDPDGLGVATVRMAIDGKSVADVAWPGRPGSCTDVDDAPDQYHYNTGQPCAQSPQTATLELPDSPDGNHQVTLSVVDAAGNSTVALDHRVTLDRLAPVLSQDPSVSGGLQVGSPLQCSIDGVDAQDPSTAYQWVRSKADGSDAQEVAGAAQAVYTLTQADVGSKLLCRVTVTDHGGSTTRTSSLTSGPFDGGQTVVGGNASAPSGSAPGAGAETGSTGTSGGTGTATGAGNGATGSSAGGAIGSATVGTASATAQGPSGLGSVQGPAAPVAGCPVGTLVTLEGSSRLVARRASSAASVAGAVRSGTGAPAAGIAVDLVQRVRRAGTTPVTVASGLSGADGRFSLKAPVGPSRDLQVVTRSCGAAGPVVGQTVRGQLKLRAVNPRVRNGQAVRFSGQALGGYYGKGVGLELQVLVGRKWQDVRAVRTDRSGKFRTSYRFKRTYVRYTYRFRVITRATAGWPYTATRSPVAKDRVN